MGVCPKMACPIDHHDGNPRILDYSKWKKSIPLDVTNKYDSLANGLLLFLCGGCHSLKSLRVNAFPQTVEQFHVAKKQIEGRIVLGHTIFEVDKELERFCHGISTVDHVFQKLVTFLPSLQSDTDRNAWGLFQNVLVLIADPERQASLHIRYLRSRPRMWTPCCNREHCFRCKTINYHEGKTCDENTALLDASIVNCPACGIAITKGDGCNTVTCICFKQFSWSVEKENQDRSNRFAQNNQEETAKACAYFLVAHSFAHGRNITALQDATAWQSRHVVEVNRELMRWWASRYNRCPSQACAVMTLHDASLGVKQAADLWIASHSKEVDACKRQNRVAVRSIFPTMYSRPNQQAAGALSLLKDRRCLHPDFRSKHARLLESAALWMEENRSICEQEEREREKRLAAQFLHIYGQKCAISASSSSSVPSIQEWSREASNSHLAFTNDNSTAKRHSEAPLRTCLISSYSKPNGPSC